MSPAGWGSGGAHRRNRQLVTKTITAHATALGCLYNYVKRCPGTTSTGTKPCGYPYLYRLSISPARFAVGIHHVTVGGSPVLARQDALLAAFAVNLFTWSACIQQNIAPAISHLLFFWCPAQPDDAR